MEQREYFEYLSDRGTARRMLRRLFLRPIARYFSGRVLDIGAGIGEFLSLYPDAVGIDLNRDCASFCSARGMKCVQASAAALPFRTDSFDGVLLNNVLEHLDDPEQTISETVRVMRNGGKICAEVPGRKGYSHDSTHVKFWDKDGLTSLLAGHGFRDIRAQYFPVPLASAGDFLTHNKLRVFGILRKV